MFPEQQQIFWYSGLYLQPQHLQSIDLHHSYMLAQLRCQAQPWHYGLQESKINHHMLNEFVVKIETVKVVFESGYFLQYPGNAIVNSYDFRDKWTLRETPLRLFLALRRFDPSTTNVSQNFAGRWVSDNETSIMKDVYHDGPESTVSRIAYNLQIMSEDEVKTSTDCEYLPWLQLKYEDNKVILDPDFSPPVINLATDFILRKEIEAIISELSTSASKYEEYKDFAAIQKNQVELKNVFQNFVMIALNRTLPVLYHYIRAPSAHPSLFYSLFVQLVGELSVLNEHCSFMGKWKGSQKEPLRYCHESPLACFREIKQTIFRLLDPMIFDDNVWIALFKNSQDIFNCELSNLPDGQTYSLLLALRSEKLDGWKVLIPDSSAFKVSSERHINKIIHHALNGVALDLLSVTPRGLPKRDDTYYFKLDIHSENGQDILKTHHLSFYWAEAPDDLDVKIVIIRV